jgi:hypothetical protein
MILFNLFTVSQLLTLLQNNIFPVYGNRLLIARAACNLSKEFHKASHAHFIHTGERMAWI